MISEEGVLAVPLDGTSVRTRVDILVMSDMTAADQEAQRTMIMTITVPRNELIVEIPIEETTLIIAPPPEIILIAGIVVNPRVLTATNALNGRVIAQIIIATNLMTHPGTAAPGQVASVLTTQNPRNAAPASALATVQVNVTQQTTMPVVESVATAAAVMMMTVLQ